MKALNQRMTALGSDWNTEARPKWNQDVRVIPNHAVVEILHTRCMNANHKGVRDGLWMRCFRPGLPVVVVDVKTWIMQGRRPELLRVSEARLPFVCLVT